MLSRASLMKDVRFTSWFVSAFKLWTSNSPRSRKVFRKLLTQKEVNIITFTKVRQILLVYIYEQCGKPDQCLPQHFIEDDFEEVLDFGSADLNYCWNFLDTVYSSRPSLKLGHNTNKLCDTGQTQSVTRERHLTSPRRTDLMDIMGSTHSRVHRRNGM